jgi:translation initiation factor IF-1
MTSVAVVMEILPRRLYLVKLANESVVLVHPAGAAVRNFERLRPGDRVEVELSPHDPGRGRLVKFLEG